MNWLDAIYFVIITINTVNGLRKGLVVSLFSLVNLVLSFTIAIKTFRVVSEILVENFSLPEMLSLGLSFIIVWFLIHTLIAVFTKELHNIAAHSFFSGLNVVGGAIFGSAKGFAYTLVLTILISNSFLAKSLMRITLRESLLVNFSKPIVEIAAPYLKRVKKGESISLRKYLPQKKAIIAAEENLDELRQSAKTYRRVAKSLDF